MKRYVNFDICFQHLFEVRIDDVQHRVSDYIRSPQSYRDVKVYAAKEKPSDALIRNIDFNQNPDGTITVEEINVVDENLIKELPRWGPSYEISFELKVNRFDGQILHLTRGKDPGDGIPTVVAKNYRLGKFSNNQQNKDKF